MIDFNCSDCIFMSRDMDRYQKSHDWHKRMGEVEFYQQKGKAILEAWDVINKATDDNELRNGKGLLRVSMKMKWQFEKKFLLNYGNCTKFNKPVSFMANTCQIDTQECFKHRRA